MSLETYKLLQEMYTYMCDGRIYLARELLEQVLDIDTNKEA